MSASITFAIPFYRNTSLLRIAIESAIEQRNEAWELLVCDDSGMDLQVEAMLEEVNDPRIRYIKNDSNLGMVATWNRCLSESTTDLVNLLHADDRLLPNYVDVMLSLAERYPDVAAFFCDTEIIDANGAARRSMADSIKQFLIPSGDGPELVLQGEDAVMSLMKGYFIMTPTLCYRKSRIGERRFDPEFMQVQDLVFIIGLLLEGETIVGAKERAYAYRRHDESATSRQSESMLRFDEEVVAFDRIADATESKGWRRAAQVSRGKRIIKLHLLYRALRSAARLQFGSSLGFLRYRLGIR